MKKKLSLLLAAVGAIAAFTAPSSAMAACNDGTSQVRDAETGEPTGVDTLNPAPLPSGSTVYGDGAEENLDPGYLGITGERGFIEVSGNNDADPNVQVDGTTAGGEVDGRVGVDTGAGEADLCLNDNEVL